MQYLHRQVLISIISVSYLLRLVSVLCDLSSGLPVVTQLVLIFGKVSSGRHSWPVTADDRS